MSSLYKRANPVQKRMLRIVEGAVLNALDAHPEIKDRNRFARSVAKRAVGTLSSQLMRELAGDASSVTTGEVALDTSEPSAG